MKASSTSTSIHITNSKIPFKMQNGDFFFGLHCNNFYSVLEYNPISKKGWKGWNSVQGFHFYSFSLLVLIHWWKYCLFFISKDLELNSTIALHIIIHLHSFLKKGRHELKTLRSLLHSVQEARLTHWLYAFVVYKGWTGVKLTPS